ncbi:MAG: hypothetical protein IPG79_18590 [Saprospiraceae bacterium]|nr:hypothetical protein [Saprospiraceae bacterium]
MAHLPFAIIMLVIMIIHVAVTIAFGYTDFLKTDMESFIIYFITFLSAL